MTTRRVLILFALFSIMLNPLLLSSAVAETWPDPQPPLIGKGGENDVAQCVFGSWGNP